MFFIEPKAVKPKSKIYEEIIGLLVTILRENMDNIFSHNTIFHSVVDEDLIIWN